MASCSLGPHVRAHMRILNVIEQYERNRDTSPSRPTLEFDSSCLTGLN